MEDYNVSTMPKTHFLYSVYAVIFGVDASVVNIQMRDDFSFQRMSLNPRYNHLDEIFNRSAMELRRDYEGARIDENSIDVICAIKKVEVDLFSTEAGDYFEECVDRDIVSLDNQIRAIRLLQECSVYFRRAVFHMNGEINEYGNCGFRASIPISESAGTRVIRKLHCDGQAIAMFNQKLPLISFPLSDHINNGYTFYDLSYHHDNEISIMLLMTALELFYVNCEKAIKMNLSRRCAVYLYKEEGEIRQCFLKLREIYKKRSNFVHNGIKEISDDDILFLRHCVRSTILLLFTDMRSKSKRVEALDAVIETLQCWDTE